MINFNPNTDAFIRRMADVDSGTYIILGKEKAGKTTVLRKYLRNLPRDSRKMAISEDTKTFDEGNAANLSGKGFSGTASCLTQAIHMYSSAIVVDNNQFLKDHKQNMLEALESLAMFSTANNAAISFKHESLEEFIRYIDNIFESPEGSLTKMGFLKSIKGITLVEEVKVYNIGHRVQTNLMLDEKALAVLSSSNTPEEKVKGLRLVSKQQGNLSVEEQTSPTFGKGISKASQLVLRDFMETNTTGIVVVAGGAGSGKTSLLRAFIKDNHSRGLFGAVMAEHSREYQDLMFVTQACVGFSPSEKDEKFQIIEASSIPIDYIIFDEIRSVEEMAYALKLSETYRVFIGFHAHDHYGVLERMIVLSEGENIRKLVAPVQVIFKVDRQYDAQMTSFRFTSSPVIFDDEIRKNIAALSAFPRRGRVARGFIEEIVKEQGF